MSSPAGPVRAGVRFPGTGRTICARLERAAVKAEKYKRVATLLVPDGAKRDAGVKPVRTCSGEMYICTSSTTQSTGGVHNEGKSNSTGFKPRGRGQKGQREHSRNGLSRIDNITYNDVGRGGMFVKGACASLRTKRT
jgi:hypothetical protein